MWAWKEGTEQPLTGGIAAVLGKTRWLSYSGLVAKYLSNYSHVGFSLLNSLWLFLEDNWLPPKHAIITVAILRHFVIKTALFTNNNLQRLEKLGSFKLVVSLYILRHGCDPKAFLLLDHFHVSSFHYFSYASEPMKWVRVTYNYKFTGAPVFVSCQQCQKTCTLRVEMGEP